MRRDWTERLRDWGIGYAVGALVMALLVWVFSGCVLFRPWAPQPSAPPRECVGMFVYPDSAGHCVPPNGTRP